MRIYGCFVFVSMDPWKKKKYERQRGGDRETRIGAGKGKGRCHHAVYFVVSSGFSLSKVCDFCRKLMNPHGGRRTCKEGKKKGMVGEDGREGEEGVDR